MTDRIKTKRIIIIIFLFLSIRITFVTLSFYLLSSITKTLLIGVIKLLEETLSRSADLRSLRSSEDSLNSQRR